MGDLGNPKDLVGNTKPSSVEKATLEEALWATRTTEIPSNMQMRGEYDASGNAVYLGYAPRGLTSSASGWLIQKFTYDGSGNMTLRQISYASWDLRADGGTVYA